MNTQTKKQTTVIALIFALIISVVLGATCFISSAFADNNTNTCSATAKITASFDAQGNITIPNTELKNDTDYVVTVKSVSIESSYSFVSDWTNDFVKDTTLNPGEALTISWSATSTVPASFDGTDEVHVGTITYTYSYDVQAALSGDVTITNNGNGTLTAKADNLADGAIPHYTWYNEKGEKIGEGETFTVPDGYTGKITVVVTDESGKYTGEISSSTEIVKEKLTGTVTIDGLVDGKAQVGTELTAQVSGVQEDADLSYTWYVVNDDGTLSEIKGATEQTYTPTPEYAGKTIMVEVTDKSGKYSEYIHATAEVITNTFTVAFHSNGATANGNDTTESDDEVVATQTANVDDEITLSPPNTLRKSANGYLYNFEGWNTESDGTGTTYSDEQAVTAADLGAKAGDTINLYAKWTTETGSYWMAPSMKIASATEEPQVNPNYTDPKTGIMRNQSQIDEDMKVLHGTLTDSKGNKLTINSEGKDKSALETLYNGYSSADNYHLYTAWNGDDVTDETSPNKYVEFRIIQVGEHDGDGSVITFMATHSLPTADPMNPTVDNITDWSGSLTHKTMNEDGGYVMTGLKDLVSAKTVLPVKKMQATYKDSAWQDAVIGTASEDTFWLLSHTEVFGNNTDNGNTLVPTYFSATEGSQYAWLSAQGVNAKSGWDTVNNALKNMDRSRASISVAPTFPESWWLRSPYISDYAAFGAVKPDGNPTYLFPYLHYCGVVPAFCF